MPKINPAVSITAEQHQVLIGTLLGDGWIELGAGKNPRVGLQLSERSCAVIQQWVVIMGALIEQKVYTTVKQYDLGPKTNQLSIRTQRNVSLTPYLEVFKPLGGNTTKVVPSYDWLMANFEALGLAWFFMQDGSRHGIIAGAGFELHSQGFGFESTARLCLVLWDKFNLYAWPTRETKPKLGKEYWHVYISADSFSTMVSLLKNRIPEDVYNAKFHPLGATQTQRVLPNGKNKQAMFYNAFSGSQLKNDVLYKESEQLIKRYATAVSDNLAQLPP